MSFKIVMNNLEKKENITPILIAWSSLMEAHKAGFITYRVVYDRYTIGGNYYKKAKEWERKRQEIGKFCSQEITLDLLPKSPVAIGKELLKEIANRSDDEKRDIFTALGYGKKTGLSSDEKMKASIIQQIKSSFYRK